MPQNKIILGANHAGLGGRLKTIAWGKALATISNLDYKFIWPLSDACGGITLEPSKDLITNINFYIPATPWIEHNSWMQYSASYKQISRMEKMQSYSTEFTAHNKDTEITFNFSQDNEKLLNTFADNFGILLQYKGAGVVLPKEHSAPLHNKYINELRNLTPSDAIIDKVRKITDEYDFTSCIGVHVRRGDVEEYRGTLKGLNKRYIHEEQYFNRLDRSVEPTSSSIFLCTENEEVAKAFKKRYGSKVIHQPLVENHRGSVEGVQDAYSEILLLSRCKYIIGGHSNFSELAALIGGIDFYLLDK